MNGRLVVVDDVAAAFTRLVIDRATEHDSFALALSGGDTARTCYEHLAVTGRDSLDWSAITAWWGDERCVALDDVDSNFRLASEALLTRVAPLAAVHPMFEGDLAPEDAAAEYDRRLRATAPLDVVHLGLGPDGHTASLFPECDALDADGDLLVVSTRDPLGTNRHDRITFTYAGIERARSVIVTVAGAAKTDALHRVLDGDRSAPAANLRSADLVWLVDAEAMGTRDDR